ncbi:hypothetical protein [Microbacterium oleivorans]|uniref:hypothetical protein n=1 Tax=Microbacterium TaxID=33882 RepID=UPI00203F6C77|nr:hypothetical protein [Microbacterium oleivorans]MCM3695449.1 hypothetical protein [Microbacterium oleivorans]
MSDANHARDGVQSGPSMSQNPADDGQRLEGILVQCQADLAGQDGLDPRLLLERRLKDAGITLSDEQMTAALARLGV